MASSRPERDPRLQSFLESISARPDNEFPEWVDSQDLGRLHVQAFVRDGEGGFDTLKSRGALRLTGAGVVGHSVNLTDVSQILENFQNLVTASGAAAEGQTNTRGRIREDTVRRTQLMLRAAPAPGSLIMKFEPRSDEAAERYPDGQAGLDEPQVPLVERSVETALSILSVAARPQTNSSEIESLFGPLGPRVASAARSLAESASGSSLGLHLTWERAGFARKSVTASAEDCAMFALLLVGTGLDSEPLDLRGQLRTISDRRKIDLEIKDPDDQSESIVIAVERENVALTGFMLGDYVEMRVLVEVTRRPGGGETKRYKAAAIRPLK